MKFTTLIPAYKHKYCIDLLIALRHQTVKPDLVIFSDDSPNQSFIHLLLSDPIRNSVADLNIQVVPGPRTGAWNNFRQLLNIFSSERFGKKTDLFHILLDDDIIYPRFYERHLMAHQMGGISCAVSRRWTALESGQPIRDSLPVPAAILSHPSSLLALHSGVVVPHTVGVGTNWIGEFSNVTFQADMAEVIADARLAGISYAGLEDLGAFVKASLCRPIGYIKEFLGAFRTSDQQHSADPMGKPIKAAFLAYIGLAMAGKRIGIVSQDECTNIVARLAPVFLNFYHSQDDMGVFCSILQKLVNDYPSNEDLFIQSWNSFSVW